MEIRRFGIGHRRPDGPPGTRGVEATPLHADERGVITELALKPNAAIAPHTNSNLTYLLVIEGGGFVQVGEERTRVAAGEAVVWPPNVVHAAWTDLTPMRAIVVEFAEAVGVAAAGGPTAGESPASEGSQPGAEGTLVREPAVLQPDRESPEKEPW
ncbi:MAG: cupin domain-containing protein [Candidatus Limnocylindrales bacterium]